MNKSTNQQIKTLINPYFRCMKKRTLHRFIRSVAIILGLSVGFGLLFAFLFGGFSIFNLPRIARSAVYSMAIGLIAWSGNELITRWVGRRWPWTQNPGLTFSIALSLCIGYTLISISAFNFLFYFPWGAQGVNWPRLAELVLINSLIAVIITVIILLAVFVRVFMKYWREGLQREEQYKRDILTAQYETLRSQVNPHFLFNSLSVLTSLVESDQGSAVKFIKKLSEVYRYVLDIREKELVTIGEELDQVRSFLYMQQLRFGNQLQVAVGPFDAGGLIVPLSVQMLIENALKHNKATDDQPLKISLAEEYGFVVCRNSFQPRELVEPSSGTGLKNIAGRCAPFTSKPVTWGVEDGCFVARIPLIV